jgi:hypothetical protein
MGAGGKTLAAAFGEVSGLRLKVGRFADAG